MSMPGVRHSQHMPRELHMSNAHPCMVLLVMGLIAALSLPGCVMSRGGQIIDEVRYGTTGLKMSFLENYPASRIDEADTFEVGIQVENAGASNIEEGYLQIRGTPPLTFRNWEWGQYARQNQDHTTTLFLEGRSKSNPNGEKGLITARFSAAALPADTQVMPGQIAVQACYAYETIFAKEVCIDPNPDPTIKTDDTCTVRDITSSGQGGPVGVSKVEVRLRTESGEQMLTTSDRPTRYYGTDTVLVDPEFRIYIRNFAGAGTSVIDADQISLACGSGNEALAWNKVDVEAFLFDTPLTCDRNSFQINSNQNNYITCWVKGGVRRKQNSYLAPLVVNMRYGFIQGISKEIQVYRRGYGANEWEPSRPLDASGYNERGQFYQSGE